MNSDQARAVVLGGAGFLGSHLVEALLARGTRVRVFDRPGADLRNLEEAGPGWTFLGGDFANEVDLDAALEGVDLVFHLASTTIPATSSENPVYDVETNLVPTLVLLDRLRRHPGRRLVFVSSGGTVYGAPDVLPVPESHATRPLVSYGVVKLAIERYLDLHHRLHGLSYAVARLANPYGPRQDPEGAQGAAAVFLGRAFRGEPVTIWGEGDVVRDYLYVDDAVAGLLAVADRGGDAAVYNIGSGTGTSLRELVDAVGEAAGLRLETRHRPAREFDVPANVLAIDRAREELGWAPRVPLTEGLRRTWLWIQARES